MKKFLTIFGNIILIILIVIGILIGFSLLPIKNNYKIYFVTSGSMEPAISTGSMVVVLPKDSYRVNEIVSFINSGANKSSETTTHRIRQINQDKDGDTTYITKGDANNSNDVGILKSDKIIGRMIFSVPFLGYIIGYIKTLPGLILIIIIPAAIVISEEVKKMRNEVREVIKRRKNKKNRVKEESQTKQTNINKNKIFDDAKIAKKGKKKG